MVQGRAAPPTGYGHLHQPGDATLPLELMQLNMESQQQRAFLQNVLQSHVHHPFGVHPLARVLAGLPAGADESRFGARLTAALPKLQLLLKHTPSGACTQLRMLTCIWC